MIWLTSAVPVGQRGLKRHAILATTSFTNAVYWLCRQMNAAEQAFNAVERVEECEF